MYLTHKAGGSTEGLFHTCAVASQAATERNVAEPAAGTTRTRPRPHPMAFSKKTKLTRRIKRLAPLLTRHGTDAATLLGTLLDCWCRQAFPGLPKSGIPRLPALAAEAEVKAFIELLVAEEFLEASYWLSSVYAILSNEDYRRRMAMYFTPPSLTKRLLDDLQREGISFRERSFCDPACGGAAFLAPIAQRMREQLLAEGATAQEVVSHVESHVFGSDRDSVLCNLSRHFLLMVLHDEVAAGARVPQFRIGTTDSLSGLTAAFGTMDVIVCNPPFRKMTATEVAPHRPAFAEVIEAQPNIYGLFIALCAKLLKPGGSCALVTPTSYLSGQNFSRLRQFLARETRILSIGMVSDRQGVFIDVEQETALTLFRRELPTAVASASASVSVVAEDGSYVSVGACALSTSGAAWAIPRTESDVALLASASKSSFRLCHYGYSVRIGTYVWNRDTRPAYVSEAMAAAHCKTRTAVPLLWSSDINADGTLSFDGLKKANSERCFVNLGSKTHPSVVQRPSVLLQRVTSNDQPRRLVAAAVPAKLLEKHGGFVGENHTVILEQTDQDSAWTPNQMAQLIGSGVVDRYFRCISGATNVSSFELGQLCLPDPKRLLAFIRLGHSIPDAARMALTETVACPPTLAIRGKTQRTQSNA